MEAKLTWLLLFFCLILQVDSDHHLSKQVVDLLTDEESPKCFSRNLEDLTCFWEAPEGKSYEFIYKTDDGESKCSMNEQKTEDGRLFHVCYFPPSDVFIYTYTFLRVIDSNTNTTIYNREINVEQQLLLDPPSNTSLHLTGEVGQLLVRWQTPAELAFFSQKTTFFEYEIHYVSKPLQDTFIQFKSSKCEHTLLSLVPGELYTVRMRLKPNDTIRGHWSDWSHSVTAMVAEPAENTELRCHTPDLQQVRCRWNERNGFGTYTLHYRQTDRGSWGSWRICGTTSPMQCVLYGEQSTMFEVYLTADLKPVVRTFYLDVFWMNSSIKTDAPDGLIADSNGERHCLRWNSPLQNISQYLIYMMRYRPLGETDWKVFIVPNPKTNTCLDVQVGSQYTIQVKAMPNGSLYSGHWSAWSRDLMVQLPSNTGLLFIVCVPFIFLIISLMLLSFFSRYASKLKQFLWPPVPNLNEVLESFLKDISGQHWEPNFTIKLCDEDMPPSVVEIMSEGDNQVTRKPFNCPHFSQHNSLAGNSNAVECLEICREYVTLNSGEVLPSLTGNDYVYKVHSSPGQTEKICRCSSVCYATFPVPTTTDMLNQSYVQARLGGTPVGLVEISACHYTNLERTGTVKCED